MAAKRSAMEKWRTIICICAMATSTSRVRIDESIFHEMGKLGEQVKLHGPWFNSDEKNVTWYHNDTLIVQKQPGENESNYDENGLYQLMNNGDLIILKMSPSLEGIYERFIDGNHSFKVDVRLKVEIIALKNTYKEKIIDDVIHREWNIVFNISTGRVNDCKKEMEMDVMSLCYKWPDDNICTDLTNATIVPKPGACAAKIMYNSGLQYYVKFKPVDSFDQISIDSDNVENQEFLLIQAPSTKENTIHPITNPPQQTITVSAITQNPGQETTEQLLKPSRTTNTTNTLVPMSNSVKSEFTQQPSTNLKPRKSYKRKMTDLTPARSTKENTIHPITNPPLQTNTVSAITQSPGQEATEQLLKPSRTTNTLTNTQSINTSVKNEPCRQHPPSCNNDKRTLYIVIGTLIIIIIILIIIIFLINNCCGIKGRFNKITRNSSTIINPTFSGVMGDTAESGDTPDTDNRQQSS